MANCNDLNALGEINVVGLKRFVASDACDVMLCDLRRWILVGSRVVSHDARPW